MNRNMDTIHMLLDDETSSDEKARLLSQIQADPASQREFEELTAALTMVKEGGRGRIQAPPYFTSHVMRRLAKQRPSFVEQLRTFFFRPRVVRWNIAYAFAAAGLIVLASLLFLRSPGREGEIAKQAGAVMVTLHFYAPQAHSVSVAGTFNKWSVDAHYMKPKEPGVWTIEIPLKPGVYSYMFVVDGAAWVADPNAESFEDDGFGEKNSLLRVRI